MENPGHKTPNSATTPNFLFPNDPMLLGSGMFLSPQAQTCAQQMRMTPTKYDPPGQDDVWNEDTLNTFKVLAECRKRIVRMPREQVPKAEADSTVEETKPVRKRSVRSNPRAARQENTVAGNEKQHLE